jgi:hypothetical protein
VSLDLQEQLQRSLGEAYRIERELGGGGMSRVFVALETSLQRKVVVKVLLPDLAAGVSVERFRREIYLAAQLQHPHIVPLLSAGESAGLPYFTMPYVDGESLRARLIRERELPVPNAVRVLRDVASALAYAHEQGVVHRDIKPDNVLLSHGIAVVTDFGVAKALVSSASDPGARGHAGLTSLGVTLGTPHYMAPEQGTADPSMDHRVDIYAFGATAYEILTGEPPFAGKTPHAVLGAHIATPPTPIDTLRPGIPPLLALVIMKCLEKRPADRPQKAEEIINALDTLTTPSSGTVPLAAWRRQGQRERWKRVARVGLPAAVVAGGIAALLVSRPRETRPPATAPAAESAVAVAPAPAPPVPPAATPAGSTRSGAAGPPDTLSAPEVTAPVPPPTRPRPRPRPPAALSAEDSTLLARFRAEAETARSRAVAAGADAAVIARGDSSVSRAESLGARRRTAEAVAQLSTAATLWTQAAAAGERAAAPEPAPAPAPPAVAVPPPAPPPPRDTAATPPADPAPQIRALFAEYGRAIEARSVDAIRKTYPGLQPQQAREWEEFFRGVNDVQVELQVTDLKVNGDAGEAALSGVYLFANPGTHRTQREPVSFRATVRREGGRWRIAALR